MLEYSLSQFEESLHSFMRKIFFMIVCLTITSESHFNWFTANVSETCHLVNWQICPVKSLAKSISSLYFFVFYNVISFSNEKRCAICMNHFVYTILSFKKQVATQLKVYFFTNWRKKMTSEMNFFIFLNPTLTTRIHWMHH